MFQSNVRLSHEIEAVRERISERDRDVRDLQNALKGLESDKRRIGDDHLDDRRSLELEIDRVKRDLVRSQDDLEHAQQEIDRLETSLSQQRADLSEMVSLIAQSHPASHDTHILVFQAEEKSSIESLLTSERQERLKLSDKLNAAEKVRDRWLSVVAQVTLIVIFSQSAKQAEHELVALRERIEELERNSGPSRTLTPRRGSDMAQKDASTLLQSIYIKVAKLCGIEVGIRRPMPSPRVCVLTIGRSNRSMASPAISRRLRTTCCDDYDSYNRQTPSGNDRSARLKFV